MGGSTLRESALLVGGISSSLACFVSAYNVAVHLVRTRHGSLKAYTVRILLMVPTYALEAIASIVWPGASTVLAVFRSCYEAFALFSFVQLMLAYLTLDAPSQGDGARGAIWLAFDMQNDASIPHLFPLCCLKPWAMGPEFLRRSLIGVFQYTAVMPLVTLLTGVTESFGVYLSKSGNVADWTMAYPYLSLVQNLSQCWALYSLIMFYNATSSRLKPVRPLAKFLSIKLVVFFTWWQELLIAGLVHEGLIPETDLDGDGVKTAEESATLLSNFIICIEMMVMAQGDVTGRGWW